MSGYLGSRSDITKSLSFVPLLSDSLHHSVQLVSNLKAKHNDADTVHTALRSAGTDIPVSVTGTVQRKLKPKEPPRPSPIHRNEDVEIAITSITALNSFPDAQFYQEAEAIPPERRHLQLRHDANLRQALEFRASVASLCRKHLAEDRFIEVETPLLFKSTPEGAREFLVPTRTRGVAYALPQSPQQYKQILMASGIPRYFQIAKCFRDEDLRADRQPEFTQLDLEMAFATGKDVVNVVEGLVQRLWTALLNEALPASSFPHLSYEEAMSKYGSDKPDTRLGMELMRIGHLLPVDLISKIGSLSDPIVDCFKISLTDNPIEARKFITAFMDSPESKPFIENQDGQPGIFIYDTRKPLGGLTPFGFEAAERIEEELELEEGDIIVLQVRKNERFSGGSTMAGSLRLALHKAAVTQELIDPPTGWNFLWVDQFPLFSPTNDVDPGQGGSAGIASTHHPFTAPVSAEDAALLATDPLAVKADHYDLVLNGVELGGGSRRIHDPKVQEYIFRDVLKMSNARIDDFRHLLDVLSHGCPPHAGIALGFDRLVATMLGRKSIRDVVAFPKSGKGEDLLVNSPNAMTTAQLDTYHLQLKSN